MIFSEKENSLRIFFNSSVFFNDDRRCWNSVFYEELICKSGKHPSDSLWVALSVHTQPDRDSESRKTAKCLSHRSHPSACSCEQMLSRASGPKAHKGCFVLAGLYFTHFNHMKSPLMVISCGRSKRVLLWDTCGF